MCGFKKKALFFITILSLLVFSVPAYAYSNLSPSTYPGIFPKEGDSYVLKISPSLASTDSYKLWKSIFLREVDYGAAIIAYVPSKQSIQLIYSPISSNTANQLYGGKYLDVMNYAGFQFLTMAYPNSISTVNSLDGLTQVGSLSSSSGFQRIPGDSSSDYVVILYSSVSVPAAFSGSVVNWTNDNLTINDSSVFNLTIHYEYEDGTKAAEPYFHTYGKGVSYSVDSPIIPGCSPSIKTVEGTMGDTNVEYTVVYSKERHNLTINYKYENGDKVGEAHSQSLAFGDSYSVIPPQINGYIPNPLSVSGTMGNEDIVTDVIYAKVKNTVTIHYKYLNGTTAFNDYRQAFNEGEYFEVSTPELEGYKPSIDIISGTMSNANLEYTVTFTVYTPSESSSSNESSSSSSDSSSSSSSNDSSSSSGSASNPFLPPAVDDSGSNPFLPPSKDDSGSNPFLPPSKDDSGSNPFVPPSKDENGSNPFAPPVIDNSGVNPFLPPALASSENPFIVIFDSFWSKIFP